MFPKHLQSFSNGKYFALMPQRKAIHLYHDEIDISQFVIAVNKKAVGCKYVMLLIYSIRHRDSTIQTVPLKRFGRHD